MTKTPTATHLEIKNLLTAYAVHGGDASGSIELARSLRAAEIVALTVDFVRSSKSASYRIATLADGSRYLAVRYTGASRPAMAIGWLPVFSCARLDRLVADGWTL